MKKDIKWVRSLQQKKFRVESGCFVVEGKKGVEEGLRSGFEVHSVYSADEGWSSSEFQVLSVNTREMEQMSSLNTPSPYLAVFKQRNDLPDFVSAPIVLVLDGIADPGNMGTIVRTAEWFGISAILCTHDCVELYNPKVIQATMGSIFRMRVCYASENDIAAQLRTHGYYVAAADLAGSSIYQFDCNRRLAFVIGSESHGVRSSMRSITDEFVTIPRFGQAESLNASVAAALFMSEYRSRGMGNAD